MMSTAIGRGLLLAALLMVWDAKAQTPPAPSYPALAEGEASVATSIVIPAGATIVLELVDALSSRTNHVGDTFALRLAEPIMVEGRVGVPAGAIGAGEVIDAARSDMGGEQGKLILSARYLDIGDQRVRIRGLALGALGQNRVDAAVAMVFVPYVGVFGGFIQGGEIDIPAATLAQARLAVDVTLPPVSAPTEPQAVEQATESTTGETP